MAPEWRDVIQWLGTMAGHWWTPLIFVVLYAAANLLFFPGTPLTLAAGAIWGWPAGALWALVASTLGTIPPYVIARAGSPRIESLLRRRATRIHDLLRVRGFTALLLLRLNPVVPYNILNYAAGLAGLRPRDYVAATFIGSIPGIFIYTYLASAVPLGFVSLRGAFIRVLLAGVALTALVLISRFFAARATA
jgi:uncharacterized membrane protein YdjX (TVP38/TMEM64 family)